MKLELGCGYKQTPGYMRVDANPNIPNLDWCGDVTTTMPWADGTFDEIRAVDVLEHIPYVLTTRALAEWARLLAPGGELYVQVPDCGEIMRRYAQNPAAWDDRTGVGLEGFPSIVAVAWRIMGGQDEGTLLGGGGGEYTKTGDQWQLNAHYAMFDRGSLVWYLKSAGLEVVKMETNSHPNIFMWARKPEV